MIEMSYLFCMHHHSMLHMKFGDEFQFFANFGLPNTFGQEWAKKLWENKSWNDDKEDNGFTLLMTLVFVRLAEYKDLLYIVDLSKKESKSLGFIPKIAYEAAITGIKKGKRWSDVCNDKLFVIECNKDLVGFCLASFGKTYDQYKKGKNCTNSFYKMMLGYCKGEEYC